jgi:hypothetical protein
MKTLILRCAQNQSGDSIGRYRAGRLRSKRGAWTDFLAGDTADKAKDRSAIAMAALAAGKKT